MKKPTDTKRIIAALATHDVHFQRPPSANTLYTEVCRVSRETHTSGATVAQQWIVLRKWLQKEEEVANALPTFKPYVMPTEMLDLLARCQETRKWPSKI